MLPFLLVNLLLHCFFADFSFLLPILFGFPAKTTQDRPSSIDQSLNRGTKPRHTLPAQFTLAISSLLNMHLTPRLHQTIERRRQFIHLFTETNYLTDN